MSFISKEKSVALYAALVSFGTYVFIFGFRKSFTVCTFDDNYSLLHSNKQYEGTV
jgi:hypothetical protein